MLKFTVNHPWLVAIAAYLIFNGMFWFYASHLANTR